MPVRWKEAKCIGSGAFGSVYLAYDVDTGRDLAVKKIPIIPDNRELSREVQGLEFDVQELGRLQHPRIVQYLGVQKTSDRILIFMEYMTGGSLKEHIALVGVCPMWWRKNTLPRCWKDLHFYIKITLFTEISNLPIFFEILWEM
ncbi:Mitogen-activated protein kinase kinase kinase 2 [Parelaphostrongylus tenuis]|uniref:Mitogen-activated protein kinase kinase kinase 2 n=1 Tax=Parelaphostrongylus tenuis TaxID=148309 RepID=A0AAD5QKX5_PARTN|nr:Mitogen-activated protein kinase kinase kinase 2 [Parelaphostrongylus tenuis]